MTPGKRIIPCLVAFMMVITLSACGSKTKDQSSEKVIQKTTTTTERPVVKETTTTTTTKIP